MGSVRPPTTKTAPVEAHDAEGVERRVPGGRQQQADGYGKARRPNDAPAPIHAIGEPAEGELKQHAAQGHGADEGADGAAIEADGPAVERKRDIKSALRHAVQEAAGKAHGRQAKQPRDGDSLGHLEGRGRACRY